MSDRILNLFRRDLGTYRVRCPCLMCGDVSGIPTLSQARELADNHIATSHPSRIVKEYRWLI